MSFIRKYRVGGKTYLAEVESCVSSTTRFAPRSWEGRAAGARPTTKQSF